MYQKPLHSLSVAFVSIMPHLLAAKQPTSAPAAYASPADVVAAAAKAIHDRDVETYLACLSPDALDKSASMFVGILAMDTPATAPTATNPDKDKAAFELKYGLEHCQRLSDETDEKFAARMLAKIKDKREFVKDSLTKMLAQNNDEAKANPPPKLEELHIQADGITANGKILQNVGVGTTMSQDIQFKKIDGNWVIDSLVLF